MRRHPRLCPCHGGRGGALLSLSLLERGCVVAPVIAGEGVSSPPSSRERGCVVVPVFISAIAREVVRCRPRLHPCHPGRGGAMLSPSLSLSSARKRHLVPGLSKRRTLPINRFKPPAQICPYAKQRITACPQPRTPQP
jgi:hypothetical protein